MHAHAAAPLRPARGISIIACLIAYGIRRAFGGISHEHCHSLLLLDFLMVGTKCLDCNIHRPAHHNVVAS